MADLNEIKSRINSIKNTRQITRAMYLISSAKSKKARQQLDATRPYFNEVTAVLARILSSNFDVDTPYIKNDTAVADGKRLYIVLTGDRGMAGAYNHNIIDMVERCAPAGSDVTLMVSGSMGRAQLARKGYSVDYSYDYPVMNPNIYQSREIAEMLIDKYLSKEYEHIYIIYTKMVSPLKQQPVCARLLPLVVDDFNVAPGSAGNIEYEPDVKSVFDHLTPLYLKGVIYDNFVEAFTSEQYSRMLAMDNSTKNADEMITNLSLKYNRARQAVITQEITEIVGGIPD